MTKTADDYLRLLGDWMKGKDAAPYGRARPIAPGGGTAR